MKAITVLILIILSSSAAWADNFQWTGLTAEDIDPIGWTSGGTGPIGGPIGNERLGLAQQFEITQAVNMSFLNVHATIVPSHEGTLTFHYELYSDSTYSYFGDTHLNPIPLTSSLVRTSAPITYQQTEEEALVGIVATQDSQVEFNQVLQPGKYWLAEQGTGGPYVKLETTYVDPPFDKPLATPEPSTWALMGVGLIGMFMFQRKVA